MLHFLVVLQLLFVEAHGLVVVAAEYAVTLDHSFPHGPRKLKTTKSKYEYCAHLKGDEQKGSFLEVPTHEHPAAYKDELISIVIRVLAYL